MHIKKEILKQAKIDILAKGRIQSNFVGRPFYIDYSKVSILTCDAWKHQVNGVPQGTFLLAFYDGEKNVEEALLLRVIAPVTLPTDSDNTRSMIAYYKDHIEIAGRAGVENIDSKLDQFTRFEFSCSGLDCRILGVFYRITKEDKETGKKFQITEFGADVENFYSANNYKIYKATDEILKEIVNQRDNDKAIVGGAAEPKRIGVVRYSSSRRFQNNVKGVEVFISPKDFLGKRTSLFGMTRTGKSNTLKKLIETTVEISAQAKRNLKEDTQRALKIYKQNSNSQGDNGQTLFDDQISNENFLQDISESFNRKGSPKYQVGQIIFDVNGEYANANMQDEGTAIFDLYEKDTIRYSTIEKEGFKVMKINFYSELSTGLDLLRGYFKAKGISNGYLDNFLSISLEKPTDYDGFNSSSTRYDRQIAAYKCCLYKAQFKVSPNEQLKFKGINEVNSAIMKNRILDPQKGLSYEDACTWFEWVWEHYDDKDGYFVKKKQKDGKEWADEDLKSLIAMLSGFRSSGKKNKVYGFKILNRTDLHSLHTMQTKDSFETDIVKYLRDGKIVIVDLSQGNPEVKITFSEKICSKIFQAAMTRFIKNLPNNFIQFNFEEAHNLFPKKADKDLSQIYNRIAKEGAKLNLGMIYATQEVSSISSNILKNTQNWFIAHLNNEDELKELKKYYDFSDFIDSLVRFSSGNDKGFVRMKTYSNPFVVPVQIDRFLAKDLKA